MINWFFKSKTIKEEPEEPDEAYNYEEDLAEVKRLQELFPMGMEVIYLGVPMSVTFVHCHPFTIVFDYFNANKDLCKTYMSADKAIKLFIK